jgi:alkyldihydroxyacetonephosphate synthase
MKRWNGWGDESVNSAVSKEAQEFLLANLGPGNKPQDLSFEEMCSKVPGSALKENSLVKTDAATRVRYARGQSLPDLISIRSGYGLTFPDAVAFPRTTEDVSELIAYAKNDGASIIPYGGGTSVAGHVNRPAGLKALLTISMENMAGLIDLNANSLLATFGAGVRGPDLESQLRPQGFKLGHYPQSFEYSTLGGWIATRSSGQQSLYYGRIESLFAGGTLVTGNGVMKMPPFPASAAGPDIRQMILGSEGRFGIITDATVRIAPLPEVERFEAAFFPDWSSGVKAVAKLAPAKLPLSMLRLSTPTETMTNLVMAGHPASIAILETYLHWRGAKEEKCALIYGLTGAKKEVQIAHDYVTEVVKEQSGISMGSFLGAAWSKRRFSVPYLRNTLWELGYAVDTLETATTWDKLETTLSAIEDALKKGLNVESEKVHVFTHLSHVYPTGTSIYTTYVFRLADTAEQSFKRWQTLKEAASLAIVREGATISHQHGVGRDHAPYLSAEKGEIGMRAIRALARTFDPDQRFNPGAMFADDLAAKRDHSND